MSHASAMCPQVVSLGFGVVVVAGLVLFSAVARAAGHESAPEEERPMAVRSMRYTVRNEQQTVAWQSRLRAQLAACLKVGPLLDRGVVVPFDAVTTASERVDGALRDEIDINATATRRMRLVLALPDPPPTAPAPAVVCIHGHGGDRHSPYDAGSIYKGFGQALTRQGFVTIATDVGQHAAYEADTTLMGERLNDLMRCVDYLAAHPLVDPGRIGCAGLSLGGEMALWLGAMDLRIQATISAGFLTFMDQMEHNHCMCWKFDGLRDLADFPDLYGLIAPRALQCQNGRAEPETMFTVPLARRALAEVQPVYAAFGREDRLELDVHGGGHEIDLLPLTTFLRTHLAPRSGVQP